MSDAVHMGEDVQREKGFDDAEEEDGEVQGGQVVVEEQLAAHEVEGEVVQRPAHEEEAAEAVVFEDLA